MGKTFILSDESNLFTQKVMNELAIPSIVYYELLSDVEIDEFVSKIFRNNDIDKLLIPTSLGDRSDNNMGIRIGLHLRLSANIGEKYLIPIIFITDRSLETLLLGQNNMYPLIAATQGSKLIGQDIDDISANLAFAEAVDKTKFGTNVLSKLIIRGSETVGPHSIANEWGIIQLDKVASLSSLSTALPIFKKKSSIYFKYLSSLNKNKMEELGLQGSLPTGSPLVIPSLGKKILYIDDEGHKGWSQALAKIFDGAQLEVLTGEFKNETEFLKEIDDQIILDWDLILLDLRLIPMREDIAMQVQPILSYSGTGVLKKIKAINKGTQVIIFTASNKAWNMRELTKLGADGYYIKESPEYLIPDHLSLQNYNNFVAQVEECFERGYLRMLYSKKKLALAKVTNTTGVFLHSSELALKQFFALMTLDMREGAYITLFKEIEQYAEDNTARSPVTVTDLLSVVKPLKTGGTYHLTILKDSSNKSYFEISDSTQAVNIKRGLGEISFVMAFKFGKDNAYLRKIADLVNLRNSLSHASTTQINISDLVDLIEIIDLFRGNI